MAYISEQNLLKLMLKISPRSSDMKKGGFSFRWSVSNSCNTKEQICRIDLDIAYLLNWEDIEKTFKNHLEILSGSTLFSNFSCLSRDIRSIVVNLL